MNINDTNLELAFRGFQSVFNKAFEGSVSHRDTIAMTVNSVTAEESYGWLGQFPNLREWIGDRVVKQLSSHGFKITNKTFESTVTVKRDHFEDDKLGIYTPMFSEVGRVSKQHPDEMLFNLLSHGFTATCFDGEAFFSETHPIDGQPMPLLADPLPADLVQSNMQAGDEPAWYLLDTSRAIKPMIWQEREKYELQTVMDTKSAHVFMTDKFLFGVRARMNCGFGLWQLAFGSKAPLTHANYAAARAQMMQFTGDEGQLLGIMPTHLVVPPALEWAGRNLLLGQVLGNLQSNVWKDSATLIVSPYLR